MCFLRKMSGGTYIFNKKIFKYIPEGEYSIHEDLITKLIKKHIQINQYGLYDKSFYYDIGTPEKLVKVRKIYG